MHIQIFAAFTVYFCIVLMIGLFGSRKAQSEKEFIMGGRKLNFWLTALSAHASDMSVWLFMAFPGAVVLGGAPACWIALGITHINIVLGLACGGIISAPFGAYLSKHLPLGPFMAIVGLLIIALSLRTLFHSFHWIFI